MLIGPPPGAGADAIHRWTSLAGGIEAYREEWGVDPSRLRDWPTDGVQWRAWDVTVHSAELLAQLPVTDRRVEREVGIEL